MVDGLTLVLGLNVRKRVAEVNNHEAEPALTQLQKTVEWTVKEMRWKLRSAILILVKLQFKVNI